MGYKTRTLFGISLGFTFRMAILTLSVFLTCSSVHADKLRRVKEAVRKNEPKPAAKPNTGQENRESGNDSRKKPESNRNEDDSDHDDSTVHAVAKLRLVKGAVRKHEPKQLSKPNLNRDSRNDSPDRDGHRTQYNGYHSHGSRSAGFVFISQPRTHIEPVLIPVSAGPICPPQGQVIIHQSAPVQPVFAQPGYESVVNEPYDWPVVKPVPQAIYTPMNEPVSTVSGNPSVQEIVVEEYAVGSDWFGTYYSRFWATIGSDFDGITTVGLGLHLQSPGSLGIDGSVTTLRESTEFYRDHLWIGDVNLVYEVLTRGDVRGRVGLGVNWLSDSWGTEAGFNLTAGVDLRLTDRVILSAEGDVGNLGDADFLHGRMNLARRFETCEWMLGADHYNIGGAEVNSYFTGIMFRF